MFNLKSDFSPTGDQPQAIEKLSQGVHCGLKNQVLLGVTGSGKTFTMANIIKEVAMPALIISHNKTLAGQLYQEMRNFFPDNAVSYFVSYYDFYQPEAYIPQSDTYIEKEAQINELIDKLRLQTTANILSRKDTIVVASVSCIYNIGSPSNFANQTLRIKAGDEANWQQISKKLVCLLYSRSEFDFKRGTFRIRGDTIDIYPAYEDFGYRLKLQNSKISSISKLDPLTGKELNSSPTIDKCITIYPAKHYLTDPLIFESVEKQIRADLAVESQALKKQGRLIEAQRLIRRVNYDLEIIKELGYVNGIENYSRYLDGRKPGQPPYTLIDYFISSYADNFLTFIDESHMTIPQLRGMYNGDYSRKKTLVEFGFRLKAAFDNRPLTFDEFYRQIPSLIYVSATPDEWEINQAKIDVQKLKISKKNSKIPRKCPPHTGVVEQLVRPTAIVDPEIIIRPARDEVTDLLKQIKIKIKKNEKILVTTLTKKIAEDLTDYLKEQGIRATYLHSDIKTLERSDILDNLRKNEFDVLIGINLLREGLDLPEVSLVAILDADKEGFLRSKTSLIQTMGRAARNVTGQVIIYADTITSSLRQAISEIERRRKYQIDYNKRHHLIPRSVSKPVRQKIIEEDQAYLFFDQEKIKYTAQLLDKMTSEALTPFDRKKIIKKLEKEMRKQAENLNFELAIKIREKIKELKQL